MEARRGMSDVLTWPDLEAQEFDLPLCVCVCARFYQRTVETGHFTVDTRERSLDMMR